MLLPGAVGYRSSLLRYRWPDELLSDVSFDYVTAREYWDAGNVTETGYKLSPDGRYLAVTSLVCRESGNVETGDLWERRKPPSRPFRCSMLLLARS